MGKPNKYGNRDTTILIILIRTKKFLKDNKNTWFTKSDLMEHCGIGRNRIGPIISTLNEFSYILSEKRRNDEKQSTTTRYSFRDIKKEEEKQ